MTRSAINDLEAIRARWAATYAVRPRVELIRAVFHATRYMHRLMTEDEMHALNAMCAAEPDKNDASGNDEIITRMIEYLAGIGVIS